MGGFSALAFASALAAMARSPLSLNAGWPNRFPILLPLSPVLCLGSFLACILRSGMRDGL